jgi:UPF0716 family protein affecting phage T7 exclusion
MEDIIAIGGFFTTVLALALGLPLVRSYVRQREARLPVRGDDTETLVRLARIESAIETLAVEIERISEGQRFTTKLLAERPQGAVPPAAATRVGAPVREER